MNKYWKIIRILSVACSLLGIANAFAGEINVPQGLISLTPKAAPALILSNMDGEAYDLTKSRGHWVFVHFWATWCSPCRKEIPTISEAMAKLDNKGLEFVLINTSEDEDTVFSFLGIVAPEINPLMDYDGQVTQIWQPRGLPSTFLVDPAGVLRYLALGGRPWHKPEYLKFLNQLK